MDKKKINIEELEAASDHVQDLDMAITRSKQFFNNMSDQYLAKKILDNVLSSDDKKDSKVGVDSWINLVFAGVCAIVGIVGIFITLNYNNATEYKEISKDIRDISTKASINDVRIDNNSKSIESLDAKVTEVKRDVSRHGEVILELKERISQKLEKSDAK